MKQHRLIICRGIPASGKSTWAVNWVLEDPEHRIRINMDSLRRMFGKYWVPEREPLVAQSMYDILDLAMDKRFDIVIDNMNLDQKAIHNIIYHVNIHDLGKEYAVITKCFKTDADECVARDEKREGDQKIGEKVIRSIYEKYEETIKTMEDTELC